MDKERPSYERDPEQAERAASHKADLIKERNDIEQRKVIENTKLTSTEEESPKSTVSKIFRGFGAAASIAVPIAIDQAQVEHVKIEDDGFIENVNVKPEAPQNPETESQQYSPFVLTPANVSPEFAREIIPADDEDQKIILTSLDQINELITEAYDRGENELVGLLGQLGWVYENSKNLEMADGSMGHVESSIYIELNNQNQIYGYGYVNDIKDENGRSTDDYIAILTDNGTVTFKRRGIFTVVPSGSENSDPWEQTYTFIPWNSNSLTGRIPINEDLKNSMARSGIHNIELLADGAFTFGEINPYDNSVMRIASNQSSTSIPLSDPQEGIRVGVNPDSDESPWNETPPTPVVDGEYVIELRSLETFEQVEVNLETLTLDEIKELGDGQYIKYDTTLPEEIRGRTDGGYIFNFNNKTYIFGFGYPNYGFELNNENFQYWVDYLYYSVERAHITGDNIRIEVIPVSSITEEDNQRIRERNKLGNGEIWYVDEVPFSEQVGNETIIVHSIPFDIDALVRDYESRGRDRVNSRVATQLSSAIITHLGQNLDSTYNSNRNLYERVLDPLIVESDRYTPNGRNFITLVPTS